MIAGRWGDQVVWSDMGRLWYVGDDRPDIIERLQGPVTIMVHPPQRDGVIVEPYPESVRITSLKRWRGALEVMQASYSRPEGCEILEDYEPPDGIEPIAV